jgi:hypothetical protein
MHSCVSYGCCCRLSAWELAWVCCKLDSRGFVLLLLTACILCAGWSLSDKSRGSVECNTVVTQRKAAPRDPTGASSWCGRLSPVFKSPSCIKCQQTADPHQACCCITQNGQLSSAGSEMKHHPWHSKSRQRSMLSLENSEAFGG